MVLIVFIVIYVGLLIYFSSAIYTSIEKKNKFKACISGLVLILLIYIGYCAVITAHNIVWSLPGVENKASHLYNCSVCLPLDPILRTFFTLCILWLVLYILLKK